MGQGKKDLVKGVSQSAIMCIDRKKAEDEALRSIAKLAQEQKISDQMFGPLVDELTDLTVLEINLLKSILEKKYSNVEKEIKQKGFSNVREFIDRINELTDKLKPYLKQRNHFLLSVEDQKECPCRDCFVGIHEYRERDPEAGLITKRRKCLTCGGTGRLDIPY